MKEQVLPPESLTNEAIAARLTGDALESLNKGIIKKKTSFT